MIRPIRPSIVALCLGLWACPEAAPSGQAPEQPARCREVGQRCEFSPGKLGSCVLLDTCKGNDCFVCQSQH